MSLGEFGPHNMTVDTVTPDVRSESDGEPGRGRGSYLATLSISTPFGTELDELNPHLRCVRSVTIRKILKETWPGAACTDSSHGTVAAQKLCLLKVVVLWAPTGQAAAPLTLLQNGHV